MVHRMLRGLWIDHQQFGVQFPVGVELLQMLAFEDDRGMSVGYHEFFGQKLALCRRQFVVRVVVADLRPGVGLLLFGGLEESECPSLAEVSPGWS